MGLSQLFLFKCDGEKLIGLLNGIGYEMQSDKSLVKKTESMEVTIWLREDGIYVDRNGTYFEELGLLIESLGNITSEITVTDYP